MGLPSGTRNYTYAEDMAILRTRTHWVLFIAFIIFLFMAPLYLSNYWLGVANLIGITIVAATGLNILVGYCGQLSIGHAGFIAVGAYTAAVLTSRFELPFLVGLISAGLMAGVIGLIFGLPSVRVKGFYLSIPTIASHFIIIWVINHWSLTGGFVGIKVPYASIGGYVFSSEASQFYLITSIAILTTFCAKNLVRTRIGRAFIAIRDNDLAAEVMGIDDAVVVVKRPGHKQTGKRRRDAAWLNVGGNSAFTAGVEFQELLVLQKRQRKYLHDVGRKGLVALGVNPKAPVAGRSQNEVYRELPIGIDLWKILG